MSRKLSVILLLMFLALNAVSAGSNPWVPDRFLLGAGNDLYTYGLPRNDDDQYSYSLNFRLEAERWFLRADLGGVTNRGWREGWQIESGPPGTLPEFYNGRIDYTPIIFGFKWNAVDLKYYSLYLEPGFGLTIAGNTQYVYIQNLMHRIKKIREVNLPYDFDGHTYVYPLQSLLMRNNFKVARFEDSVFNIALDAYAEISYGFFSTEHAALRLSLTKGHYDYMSISLGYRFSQSWSESKTMELYTRYINGPFIDFEIDADAFKITYRGSLNNHYGYGLLLIDAMKLFQKSSWQESDFTFSYGMSKMLGRTYTEVKLESGKWYGLSLVLKNRYVAGNPIDASAERLGFPDEFFREKFTYSFYTVGVRYTYTIPYTRNWLDVYGEASIGFSQHQMSFLLNTLQSGYYLEQLYTIFSPLATADKEFGFVADLEIGLTVIPEGLLKFGNSTLRLSLFGAATFISNGDALIRDITTGGMSGVTYADSKYVIGGFMLLRYGISVNLGFDC